MRSAGWLREALERPTLAWLILTGAAAGLCLHTHSTGLLGLAILSLICILRSRAPLLRRAGQLAVMLGAALLCGGPRYIGNIVDHGNPLRADVAVMTLPQVDLNEYMHRDRGLETVADRVLNGCLKGFKKWDESGVAHWLFAAAMIFAFRQARGDDLSTIFLWVVAIYYALVVASVAAGVTVMVRNDRYALTVQPFVVYHAALFLGRFYDRLNHR
ncbi:MAG: hypothetical protein ISS72_04190 [Candidatus Brocadiae bacterium]|nr:hypothetical protein [Candidatus Brocadiia bacterium]